MTKSDLINAVHAAAAEKNIEVTKKATGELIDLLFDAVSKAVVADERFSYPDFGTFSVKHRKGRTGRNPRTGEPLEVPASNTVGFKPAPALKEKVNPKKAEKPAKKGKK